MADTNSTPTKRYGKTLGQSGTYMFGGFITSEEYNRSLIGKSGLKIYDIMRRSDSTIRSTVQVVLLPLLAAKWTVQPAKIDKDTPNAKTLQELADNKARFINRELFHRNVDFPQILKSMATGGITFGFDVAEKTLELTEFEGQTRIGIAKIDKRKQTTILKWESDNGDPGVTQSLINETVYIPMDKLIVFTHDKEGDNYEGISMLRYVYKDWDIKDKLTIVNAIAIEKMAIGVPVIEEKEGQTAGEPDKQKAEETLRNFRANEEGFISMPSSLGVAMLDMKSNTTKEVIPTLNYHDRRISQSILAQFMDLGGSAGSGSQSLSKDLTSLFMKSEQALAQMIISTLQQQLIKQLCDFNYSDMSEGYPQLVCTNIADDDITALANAASSLAQNNLITPDAELEDHLRDTMGLPALSEEKKANYSDLIAPAVVPATPNATPDAKKKDLPDDKKSKKASLVADARKLEERFIQELWG